jgi:hypothetical protein
MAGGGLMQFIAYGAQDVYLRGDPCITFRKTTYRRFTTFSVENTLRSYNTDSRKYVNFEVLFDDKNNKYNDANNVFLNSIDLNNFNNHTFFTFAPPSEILLIKEPKKEEKYRIKQKPDFIKLLTKQAQKAQRAVYNRQIKNQIKRR